MENSPFDTLVGNEAIKGYLMRMVATNSLHHSLLFAGPDGVGKSLFALQLAQILLGKAEHPDLHHYRPEGKLGLHSIQSMRQFSQEVYMAPFAGNRKVFIIQDAERMLPTSANALLKTFEEPASDTLIILVSSAPASLLPTILSRCYTIPFQPLSTEAIAHFLKERHRVEAGEADRLAHLSQGSIGQAIVLLEKGDNPARRLLLDTLAKGKLASYRDLTHLATALGELIESDLKEIGSSWRSQFVEERRDQLTATQRQTLEKEVEGALAMRERKEAQSLYDALLAWYRDMALLQVGGNRAYLIHRDYEEGIEQALQRGEILPLETVQEALSEARLSLERSTSLHLCLETLFMKLSLY